MTTLLETGLHPQSCVTRRRRRVTASIVLSSSLPAWSDHVAWRGQDRELDENYRRRVWNKHHPALLHPWTEDAYRRHHRLRRGQAVLLDNAGRASGRYRHRRGYRPIGNWTKGRFSGPIVSRSGAGRSRVAATRRNRTRLRRSGLHRLRHPAPDQRRRALSRASTPAICSARLRTTSARPSAPRDRPSRSRRPARRAQQRSSLASRQFDAEKPTPRYASQPTVPSMPRRWCDFRSCRRYLLTTTTRVAHRSPFRRTDKDS